MQTVPTRFRDAVLAGNFQNAIIISVLNGDGTLFAQYTGKQIVADSLDLTQAICDDTALKFGGCIASCLEIELAGVQDFTGRRLQVDLVQTARHVGIYPGDDLFPNNTLYPGWTNYAETFSLFHGRIDSCKLQKNHITRRIIAYDDFAYLAKKDCTDWYRDLYSNALTVTLGDLRDAILNKYGITQAATGDSSTHVNLPADSFPCHMLTCDGINPVDLLRQIAEINGVFLRFDGLGELEYVTIGTTNETYPYYIDAEVDDFTHPGYDGLYVPALGYYGFDGGTGTFNCLYTMDNELFFNGYTSTTLTPEWVLIRDGVENHFAATYTPARLKADARLWLETGDRFVFGLTWFEQKYVNQVETIVSHPVNVHSVVLSRHITGIAAIQDEFTARADSDVLTETE